MPRRSNIHCFHKRTVTTETNGEESNQGKVKKYNMVTHQRGKGRELKNSIGYSD
jgi:hypothetical protein